MTKHIYILALSIFLMLTSSLNAQNLGIDSTAPNLNTLPDTITLNDSYTHNITILNYSSTPLTGVIYLVGAVDSTGGVISVDTLNSVSVTNFGIGDTVSLTYTETYNIPNSYKVGGNIVVVWPVADFGTTNDSLYKNVHIQNASSVEAIKSSSANFLIYPNPFKEQINIKSTAKVNVKQVRIFDVSGALIIDNRFTTQINTTKIKPGIYFVELIFNDNKKEHYKMIKE